MVCCDLKNVNDEILHNEVLFNYKKLDVSILITYFKNVSYIYKGISDLSPDIFEYCINNYCIFFL